ncbi:Major sperm protein [Trichuris trichiura]|uniref:Major sperm protein n=1 Tax=Trichuris trichiura TaxID=36087 RepID=A0A077Z4X5_TRITR|nr:Major sperm protein [Trichuris trichiura]
MVFWYRLSEDAFEQIQAAAMVEVFPTFVVFTPSYKKSSVVKAVMVNAGTMPVTFKLKSTQNKYLTASPTYGKIAPQAGHVFFIKLHRVGNSDFKPKPDRLSIHLAVMKRAVKRPNYVAFWHQPVGPPKVSVVRTVTVKYNTMDGTPPWEAFSSTTDQKPDRRQTVTVDKEVPDVQTKPEKKQDEAEQEEPDDDAGSESKAGEDEDNKED